MSAGPFKSAQATRRWFYGPVPDLLFGCGALYAFIALAFAINGGSLFYAFPPAVPAMLIALISAPHYGATLVRVYANREDRRAYFLFSFVATGVLIALFFAGLVDRWIGSVLTSIYLTWSGWHYTAQNYGIASLFLRRRGVELVPHERRLLYASFVCSYAIVFLVLHRAGQAAFDPTLKIEMMTLGLPAEMNRIMMPLMSALYVGSTLAAAMVLLRRAPRPSDLVPTLLVIGTQALWLTIPFAAKYFGWFETLVPFSANARAALFTWIAGAHALQYLWITSFYAGGENRWSGQTVYYARVLAAGSAVWILPALFFAPSAGSFDWNFAILLSASINLHHFVLDGVIWKLRHMKIARILIRDEPVVDPDQEIAKPRIGPLRLTIVGGTTLALLLHLHSLIEEYAVFPAALERRDPTAAAASLSRQDWLGRTNALKHLVVGQQFDRLGQHHRAIEQYEFSAGMEPHIATLRRLVVLYSETTEVAGFVDACDRLFDLEGVDRPMPTPTLLPSASRIPEAFREACLTTARTAVLSDRTDDRARERARARARSSGTLNAYQ